jgi:hypothetical protein
MCIYAEFDGDSESDILFLITVSPTFQIRQVCHNWAKLAENWTHRTVFRDEFNGNNYFH